MKCLTVAATVLVSLLFVPPIQAAAAPECVEEIDLEGTGAACERSAEEVRQLYREGPSSGYRYRLDQRFHVDPDSDDEFRPIPCTDPPNTFSFELHRANTRVSPLQWEYFGTVCLGSPEEVTQQLTAEDVAREFRRLTWPAATLNVQPADGETLVNLPTVFHADNNDPITQTINLLGQTVVIEATPVEWTWHWAQRSDDATADDVLPHTTSHPGAPHPDATITHTYRTSGMTVRPSVDVTYQGRYRLNNGPWQDIPDPHTVPGPATEPLAILEARPALVP